MNQTEAFFEAQTQPELNGLVPTVQQLTDILAAPEKCIARPRTPMERWFWLIVTVGLIGVPLLSAGLLWAVAIFLGPQIVFSANPPLDVGPIVAQGQTHLCPGESLDFSFDVDVLQSGAYELNMSTWREAPPSTVIFSEADKFVVAQPTSFLVERTWRVPVEYINPATNKSVDWEPGQYARHVYVTAVGRNTLASIQKLSFTIRENCR